MTQDNTNISNIEDSIMGVDYTSLNINMIDEAKENWLYYGDMILTDKPFIKHVYSNCNMCWVQLPENIDDSFYSVENLDNMYLATSSLKGVAIFTSEQNVAFGKLVNIIKCSGKYAIVDYKRI